MVTKPRCITTTGKPSLCVHPEPVQSRSEATVILPCSSQLPPHTHPPHADPGPHSTTDHCPAQGGPGAPSHQHTAHGTLHTTHGTRHTAHSPQHTPTAHNIQHTAHNIQHTAHNIRPTAHGTRVLPTHCRIWVCWNLGDHTQFLAVDGCPFYPRAHLSPALLAAAPEQRWRPAEPGVPSFALSPAVHPLPGPDDMVAVAAAWPVRRVSGWSIPASVWAT